MASDLLSVRIVRLDDRREWLIALGTNPTVETLVTKTAESTGLDRSQFRLIFRGRVISSLPRDHSLADCGISNGDNAITLVQRPLRAASAGTQPSEFSSIGPIVEIPIGGVVAEGPFHDFSFGRNIVLTSFSGSGVSGLQGRTPRQHENPTETTVDSSGADEMDHQVRLPEEFLEFITSHRRGASRQLRRATSSVRFTAARETRTHCGVQTDRVLVPFGASIETVDGSDQLLRPVRQTRRSRVSSSDSSDSSDPGRRRRRTVRTSVSRARQCLQRARGARYSQCNRLCELLDELSLTLSNVSDDAVVLANSTDESGDLDRRRLVTLLDMLMGVQSALPHCIEALRDELTRRLLRDALSSDADQAPALPPGTGALLAEFIRRVSTQATPEDE
ncbi:Ubiquitin family protein [Giardia muris]|uniref:Ubiquitin family protein n=1 Tax=Giardia muris TaxID=5742 RepID=A0A4Z1SL76_GIAMU|nr:Ubiquitin family protein [Giardia muris]|eukprot:TNJ26384.1 Ubiquitin family protein [Giardia muris]